MANINSQNLEQALNSNSQTNAQNTAGQSSQPQQNTQQAQMPKETEIGFHQGALNTLINERNELIKMAQNVEMIMQVHIKRLEELGIKIGQQK